VAVLLALGAALAYGVSDFVGGVLTRRAQVFVVVLLAQLIAITLLVVVVLVWGGAISWPGLWWGLAAGVAVVGGTSSLYQGLAIGRMSVVAPISGVLGAGLPVLFGLVLGERPGPAALAGIVVGLVAVVVITLTPEPAPSETDGKPDVADAAAVRTRAIGYAFGAGVGFGLFFILLERSPSDSGFWPLLGTRISMVILLVALVLIRRLSLRPPSGTGLALLALGLLNLLSDLLYLLATRSGLLSLVAVITSMYPAATIALATIALRERLQARLVVGLGIAAVSVALIATG
jgi:drug/metabolite transporter (DMT)-like permease